MGCQWLTDEPRRPLAPQHDRAVATLLLAALVVAVLVVAAVGGHRAQRWQDEHGDACNRGVAVACAQVRP